MFKVQKGPIRKRARKTVNLHPFYIDEKSGKSLRRDVDQMCKNAVLLLENWAKKNEEECKLDLSSCEFHGYLSVSATWNTTLVGQLLHDKIDDEMLEIVE